MKITLHFELKKLFILLRKMDIGVDDFVPVIEAFFGSIDHCKLLIIENFKEVWEYEYREEISNILFLSDRAEENYWIWRKYYKVFFEIIPLDYMITLLEQFQPEECYEYDSNSFLDFIVKKHYRVRSIDELTEEQFTEITKAFEDHDYVEMPSDVSKFVMHSKFKHNMITFDDCQYLFDNKFTVDFETKDIRTILRVSAENSNSNPNFSLRVFCEFVNFFAPSNTINLKRKDAFILYIFEGNEEWSESEYEIIKEYFYNIDFEESSEWIMQSINDTISNECRYITEMRKQYPNYRHD